MIGHRPRAHLCHRQRPPASRDLWNAVLHCMEFDGAVILNFRDVLGWACVPKRPSPDSEHCRAWAPEAVEADSLRAQTFLRLGRRTIRSKSCRRHSLCDIRNKARCNLRGPKRRNHRHTLRNTLDRRDNPRRRFPLPHSLDSNPHDRSTRCRRYPGSQDPRTRGLGRSSSHRQQK